jgi:hypothetical protein
MQWYATHFGIGDIDAAEAPWVMDWIKRHHNQLRYDERVYRWFWIN